MGFSQSTIELTGTIRDVKGNPIEDASVIIKNQNKGVSSKKDGTFKLELTKDKKLTIYFSHVNYKPFETWQEEGEKDLTFEANKRAKQLLKNNQPPDLEVSKREELTEFVLKKKSSMPDAFV